MSNLDKDRLDYIDTCAIAAMQAILSLGQINYRDITDVALLAQRAYKIAKAMKEEKLRVFM